MPTPRQPWSPFGAKGATHRPGGYRSGSRGSPVLFTGTALKVVSVGTAPEWMCLNAMMPATGHSALILATSVPGTEPAETSGMHCTGLASGMIFAPPLAVFGSLAKRWTSACITVQVSGVA